MLSLLLVATLLALNTLSICNANAQEKPKNPLVGNWLCEDDGTKVQIRDNGTLTINDTEYAYKVKGSNITVRR